MSGREEFFQRLFLLFRTIGLSMVACLSAYGLSQLYQQNKEIIKRFFLQEFMMWVMLSIFLLLAIFFVCYVLYNLFLLFKWLFEPLWGKEVGEQQYG